jgi:hypothetical protein
MNSKDVDCGIAQLLVLTGCNSNGSSNENSIQAFLSDFDLLDQHRQKLLPFSSLLGLYLGKHAVMINGILSYCGRVLASLVPRRVHHPEDLSLEVPFLTVKTPARITAAAMAI